MWHPELPEMKAEAVVVALLRFPISDFRENQTCTKLWSPFCFAFAPLSQQGIGPGLAPERPPAVGNPILSKDLQYESTVCRPSGST